MTMFNASNMLRAATLAVGLAGVSAPSAFANGGPEEPTNPNPCNSNPGSCGGGDVNVDVDSSATATATANSNVSVRNISAPTAIAHASGDCKSGFGLSIGTFNFSAGASFSTSDETCLDRMTGHFLIQQGVRFDKGEVAIMGLAMVANVSDVAEQTLGQVSAAYAHCGKKSMESNLVAGANVAVNGGACPTVEEVKKSVRVKAPKIAREDSVADCERIIKKVEKMCVGTFTFKP